MNKRLTIVLAIILVAVGVGGWLVIDKQQDPKTTNVADNSSTEQEKVEAEAEPEEESEDKKPEPTTGTISGSFTFPGEKIPSSLKACIADAESGEEIKCTSDHIEDTDKFAYGTGYEIVVPAGTYTVYAKYDSEKAYYNGYVSPAADTGEFGEYDESKCKTDYLPTEVSVAAGAEVSNIMLGDWYYKTSCE